MIEVAARHTDTQTAFHFSSGTVTVGARVVTVGCELSCAEFADIMMIPVATENLLKLRRYASLSHIKELQITNS